MSYNRLMNSVDVDSAALMNEYYPDFDFNRKVELVKKAAAVHKGDSSTIRISRYEFSSAGALTKQGRTETVCADRFFDYAGDTDSNDAKVWYANFADPSLFVAYDTGLFAQDEIQTLEFPLLAASKEYLEANEIPGLEPYTVASGEPTPFLFEGIPYWNRIDTDPMLSSGEHESIYGNSFARASKEAIEKGVTVFEGRLCSNILSIAAPYGYSGTRYKRSELEYILKTLLCSFSAAVGTTEKKTVIHSGNWGCGAFGGNRELMYAAQLICADICGVDRLVMHRVDEEIFDKAMKVYRSFGGETTLEGLVDYLDRRKYKWEESNGT